MKILVFDTCFNKTYIVLREDNNILASKIIESDSRNYHSVYLIPEICNILKENKILIKDLYAIGVDIGPGSFTGIRAGITIARVLAQQANIKLAGIESLRILAKINNKKNNTLVMTDARKNNVYIAKYDINNNSYLKPILEAKENIEKHINSKDTIITDISTGIFLKEKGYSSINYEEHDNMTGIHLSDIVYSELKENSTDFNWAKVKPLYIQPPSITKPKEHQYV